MLSLGFRAYRFPLPSIFFCRISAHQRSCSYSHMMGVPIQNDFQQFPELFFRGASRFILVAGSVNPILPDVCFASLSSLHHLLENRALLCSFHALWAIAVYRMFPGFQRFHSLRPMPSLLVSPKGKDSFRLRISSFLNIPVTFTLLSSRWVHCPRLCPLRLEFLCITS